MGLNFTINPLNASFLQDASAIIRILTKIGKKFRKRKVFTFVLSWRALHLYTLRKFPVASQILTHIVIYWKKYFSDDSVQEVWDCFLHSALSTSPKEAIEFLNTYLKIERNSPELQTVYNRICETLLQFLDLP
jgi:hypothetical protein